MFELPGSLRYIYINCLKISLSEVMVIIYKLHKNSE